MLPELIITEEFATRAAEWIAQAVQDSVAARGQCALSLAGGSTPRPVYQRLTAMKGIPWDAVRFYFGDERAVPPDDVESNYRMALDTLLAPLGIQPARVHRMEAERPDLDRAAQDYEAMLPDPLDLLLLGMGADGHVASLFPGAPTLAEEARRVLPAVGGTPAVARLTITPPVIRQARLLLVMVAGTDKAPAAARALQGSDDPREVPARLARRGTWILASASAALLGAAHP